jgi:predicted Zn finger-like uncharacterized protein
LHRARPPAIVKFRVNQGQQLIIQCTNCQARYQYDENRFERKPSKKIKCAKCGTVFEIHNPAFASKPAPETGDMTFAKREPAKKEKIGDAYVPPEPIEEAKKPSETPQMPQGRRLSLAIINGADAGSVYRVEKPRITIGRSGSDISLSDTEASRNHAVVEIRDTTYILQDLGSTNGTVVDGEKISAPVELQNHSEFSIGSTTIMLIVTDDV